MTYAGSCAHFKNWPRFTILELQSRRIGRARGAWPFPILQVAAARAELAVVAESFHVKPLIRILESADRYHVLGLNRQQIKLLEGNREHFRLFAFRHRWSADLMPLNRNIRNATEKLVKYALAFSSQPLSKLAATLPP